MFHRGGADRRNVEGVQALPVVGQLEKSQLFTGKHRYLEYKLYSIGV